MPLINANKYRPSFIYRRPHLGTLVPHFIHRKKTSFTKRERISTHDKDFLDIDLVQNGNNVVSILCHGLEGSSDSNYIKNVADLLLDNGFDIVAMNYRGCSGEINNNLRMYHSGATDDIHTVVEKYIANYKKAVLIGYSLGANMAIKYTGEDKYSKSDKIKAVIGISAPCDLSASSVVISRKSNYIYEKRFLISLSNKLKLKANQYPNEVDLDLLRKVKNLRDFDDYFTGPIHGFKNANEYYTLNSSNRFLPNIRIPTLIINAQNDPFLDHKVFPIDFASSSEYVHLMVPKYGGHVGFMDSNVNHSWADIQAFNFAISNLD